MADAKPPAEWPAVAGGCVLAVVVAIVGLMGGVMIGSVMSATFGESVPVLMMLFGQVAALVALGYGVRRYPALLKGVWIGGALMLILASLCVGLILTFV